MRLAILAALALFVASGASSAPAPKNSKQAITTQRSADPEQAANTIAGAIRETIQPATKDEGCQDGTDKHDSDLCAQWKAADAASEASEYSFWTLLVSAFGTGLLVWTLWETRANARRELRAYVSVRIISTGIEVVRGKTVRFTQDAVAHNGGSTPAYDFVSFGHITAAPGDVAREKLKKTMPIQEQALQGGFVIHAGAEVPMTFDNKTELPIAALDAILSGQASLYLYGTVSYLDTFKVRRRTDYCYVLASEPFRDSYIESMSNPSKQIEVRWKIAPFHNSAT